VYVALYGPKGSVIFDHPYNDYFLLPEEFRSSGDCADAPVLCGFFVDRRVLIAACAADAPCACLR